MSAAAAAAADAAPADDSSAKRTKVKDNDEPDWLIEVLQKSELSGIETGKSPESGVQQALKNIGSNLLNKTHMVISGKPYEIVELELYYFSPKHQDYFAHRDERQQLFGHFYFHRKGGAYKSGTYKGMDVTFGLKDVAKGIFGGALIRAIKNVKTQEIIEGPCLVVDHILKQAKSDSIAEFVSTHYPKHEAPPVYLDDEALPLRLVSRTASKAKTYSSGRVGLTLKAVTASNKLESFLSRHYRFVSDGKLKKGKIHTIIGMHEDSFSLADIVSATNSSAAKIKEYIEAYEKGKKKQPKDFYSKVFNNNDLCEVFGAVFAHI